MTKKMQNAKTRLLELGFIDNEWLDKYLELIKFNRNNKRITGKTQEHHAIPVNSYWTSTKPYKRAEALKLAESDKNNFKIHLLYKDHLLAHSYLTLCTNLDCIQARYEAQADLRKHNSAVGVAAANKVLNNNCCSNVIQIEHNRAASIVNLNKYYSASDVEEIMNL